MKRKAFILLCSMLSIALMLPIAANAQSAKLYDITTVAGSGNFDVNNGAALSSTFRTPQAITVLKDGSLIVTGSKSHLIRQIKDGQVSVYVGVTFDTDNLGLPIGGLVDGKKDKAIFQSPRGIATDASGNLFIADSDNNVIRKIDMLGNVTTFAGSPDGVMGMEDGKSGQAFFYHPTDIAIAANGTVYVADTLNHAIRKISPAGIVSTLNSPSDRAVQAYGGEVELAGDYKDGKLSEAKFNEPSGLALDAKGNLFVSDSGNQLVRYIDFSANMVTTVSGNNKVVYPKDALYAVGDYVDGKADEARFDFPKGIAVSAEGGLLIADSSNNAIRYLFEGKVSTLVGTSDATFGDVDGGERTARLHHPTDVAVAANGDIYVADAYNNKIKKLSAYVLPAELKVDGSIYIVNVSKVVAFDAKPELVNNRVMVPVRAVAESLGYEVNLTDPTKVILTKEDITIELTIGSLNVKKSVGNLAETAAIDSAPYIKDNRTYVPVRFISEQLSKQVDWLADSRAVIIR